MTKMSEMCFIFHSLLFEIVKGSIEALHYCKIDIKIV